MAIRISHSSLLLASTVTFAISSAAWSADHRDAPLISNLSDREFTRCPALLALPMRVAVSVPSQALGKGNISVDHYTRNSDGTVDASDYIVWNRPMGTTLSTIVNPGDIPGKSQVNEGYVTLPSMKEKPYTVAFHFTSLTSGLKKGCRPKHEVDYGRPDAVVVYWSSGAVRGSD